jgi:hypothetical protein
MVLLLVAVPLSPPPLLLLLLLVVPLVVVPLPPLLLLLMPLALLVVLVALVSPRLHQQEDVEEDVKRVRCVHVATVLSIFPDRLIVARIRLSLSNLVASITKYRQKMIPCCKVPDNASPPSSSRDLPQWLIGCPATSCALCSWPAA